MCWGVGKVRRGVENVGKCRRCGKERWGVGKIKRNEKKSVGVWVRCGKVCWVWGGMGRGVGGLVKCWGEEWESVLGRGESKGQWRSVT